MNGCLLCGEPVPPRRWRWLPKRNYCPDLDACRDRFVELVAEGRIIPPQRPDGSWAR